MNVELQDKLMGFMKLVLFGLGGGVIAFLGDNVGRFLGKRRIRIFGVRPRYTSMFLAVLVGVLIAILTVLVLSVASKDVRTYLFGMEQLKRERARLLKEIEVLSELISRGQLVYAVGQPIYIGPLEKPNDLDKVLKDVRQVVSTRIRRLSVILNQPVPDELLVDPLEYSEEELERIKDSIRKREVVIIYAKRNVFLGDKILLGFKLVDDRIVFHRGDVLMELELNGNEPFQEILALLIDSLQRLQEVAIERGKIPLPQEGGVGGKLELTQLIDIAERVKNKGKPVRVKFVVNKDVYVADTFSVDIVLEER